MNIILIVSDTLCYDCVGYHGVDPYRWEIRDRPRTPHIDRFAAQSLVFDRAYVDLLRDVETDEAKLALRTELPKQR